MEAESGAKIPFTKPLDSRRSKRHAGDPLRQRYLLRERQVGEETMQGRERDR